MNSEKISFQELECTFKECNQLNNTLLPLLQPKVQHLAGLIFVIHYMYKNKSAVVQVAKYFEAGFLLVSSELQIP